jgi:hypothetical protein
MLLSFHHYHNFQGHHGGGMHRAFAAGAVLKVLIVLLGFILAVVARYAVTQWAERTYGDPAKANLFGWLAFLAVVIIVGFAGLKVL